MDTCICLSCNRPFSVDVSPYPIIAKPLGLVGWCVDCNPGLSLGTKLGIITEIVNSWRRNKPGEWDYDMIENECHRVVEREVRVNG